MKNRLTLSQLFKFFVKFASRYAILLGIASFEAFFLSAQRYFLFPKNLRGIFLNEKRCEFIGIHYLLLFDFGKMMLKRKKKQ
jgi:hypothetical protein